MKAPAVFQARKASSISLLVIILIIIVLLFAYIFHKLVGTVILPNPYMTYQEGYPPYKVHYSGSALIIDSDSCYNGNNYRIGYYIDLTSIDRSTCTNTSYKDCATKRTCYGLKSEKEYLNNITYNLSGSTKEVCTDTIVTSCFGISEGKGSCIIG